MKYSVVMGVFNQYYDQINQYIKLCLLYRAYIIANQVLVLIVFLYYDGCEQSIELPLVDLLYVIIQYLVVLLYYSNRVHIFEDF